MTEQEIKAIEQSLKHLQEIIVDLVAQKREIEQRILEIQRVKSRLAELLPTEQRINQLFQ